MSKLIAIDKCEECKHYTTDYGFDENGYGLAYCKKYESFFDPSDGPIPDWCEERDAEV